MVGESARIAPIQGRRDPSAEAIAVALIRTRRRCPGFVDQVDNALAFGRRRRN